MERAGDWSLLDPLSLFDAANAGGSAANSLPRDLALPNEDADSVSRLLLPAQGALFITNYRVIFIGVPRDPFRKLCLSKSTSMIVKRHLRL